MGFNSIKLGLKKSIRLVISNLYYLSGVHKNIHKGKVLILMYHRVLRDDDQTASYIQPGMYVKESAFNRQMKYLSENYSVISLNELLKSWEKKKLDDNKAYCVITFDDGWLDNYENAFPVLAKYNLPATIFLVTDYVGTNNWFWPEKLVYLVRNMGNTDLLEVLNNHKFSDCLDKSVKSNDETNGVLLALKSNIENIKNELISIDTLIEELKVFADDAIHSVLDIIIGYTKSSWAYERILLNWEEVKEMSNNDITFGSHTCSHKLLTHEPMSKVKSELDISLDILKSKKISFIPVFCYPNGYYNDQITDQVKSSGYVAAVTTKYGVEDSSDMKDFNIRRIGVHNDISSTVPLFAFHLSGIGR